MKLSVCGKGGSGKSISTTLLATAIRDKNYEILVVDSDESNSSLYRMLGFETPPVPLIELIGGKRKVQKALRSKNSSENQEFHGNILTQEKIAMREISPPYIQRKNGLNLVSIGKILQSLEGCACPMGILTREFLNRLELASNEITIVDMEAGVEHFGRGVEESIDAILIIVEPSFESLNLAKKIRDLASGMNEKKTWVIINKVSSEEIVKKMENKLKRYDLEVIGSIPDDPEIFMACLEGKPVKGQKAVQNIERIVDIILSETILKN